MEWRSVSKLLSFSDPLYLGEYPLNWAASIGDKRIYNTLISYGANPSLTDSFGNTVLHVIVARDQLVYHLCHFAHFINGNVSEYLQVCAQPFWPSGWQRSQEHLRIDTNSIGLCSGQSEYLQGDGRIQLSGNCWLTFYSMADWFLIQEFWTYNIVTCCAYPLNVVDSMHSELNEKGHSLKTLISLDNWFVFKQNVPQLWTSFSRANPANTWIC